MVDSCKEGNASLRSMKGEAFLDQTEGLLLVVSEVGLLSME